MGGCFFTLAVIFFIIGLVQLLSPQSPAQPAPGAFRPTPSNTPRRVATPAAGFSPQPAGSTPSSSTSGGKSMPTFAPKFDWITVGQRVYVQHAVKGELMLHVLGRVRYTELWQQSRGPQSPWVPTGNSFLGFGLEGNLLLLNWQNRFYLLDEAVPLSDADIQRDFAPHARKFAQSDQTAEVYFAYPPAMWRIVDIGKFRVEQTEGEGLNFLAGAVGRFIHCSGDGGRALVVEDYEGGGQDTAWIGYELAEETVKAA